MSDIPCTAIVYCTVYILEYVMLVLQTFTVLFNLLSSFFGSLDAQPAPGNHLQSDHKNDRKSSLASLKYGQLARSEEEEKAGDYTQPQVVSALHASAGQPPCGVPTTAGDKVAIGINCEVDG